MEQFVMCFRSQCSLSGIRASSVDSLNEASFYTFRFAFIKHNFLSFLVRAFEGRWWVQVVSPHSNFDGLKFRKLSADVAAASGLILSTFASFEVEHNESYFLMNVSVYQMHDAFDYFS
jgi:hypothetical protein